MLNKDANWQWPKQDFYEKMSILGMKDTVVKHNPMYNNRCTHMMKMNRKKGFFSISAVAKMFSVHQQTIRLYEKQGLITPNRSDGGTRMFSEEDIDRLENIIYLTHELGINLAGVEMVLKLKKQIKKMQADMNKVFEQTQQQLDLDAQTSKEVIATSTQRLLKMRQQQAPSQPQAISAPIEPEKEKTIELENWYIDYEQ